WNWLIPGVLAQSALPTPSFVKSGRFDYVVSLLDSNTNICEVNDGVIYGYWKVLKDGTTDVTLLRDIVLTILRMIGLGKRVLVHCHAGVGRSSLMVGIVLSYLYDISDLEGVIRLVNRGFQTRFERGGHDLVLV